MGTKIPGVFFLGGGVGGRGRGLSRMVKQTQHFLSYKGTRGCEDGVDTFVYGQVVSKEILVEIQIPGCLGIVCMCVCGGGGGGALECSNKCSYSKTNYSQLCECRPSNSEEWR